MTERKNNSKNSLCMCVCVCVCVCQLLNHVWLFATPWTVTLQAPLCIEFSRQEYWSRLSCPTPEVLPKPGLNSCLLHLLHWQVDSLPLNHLGSNNSLYHLFIFSAVSLPLVSLSSRSQEQSRCTSPQIYYLNWFKQQLGIGRYDLRPKHFKSLFLCTHIYILIFMFSSLMIYPRILNIAPCTTQWDLIFHPWI